MKKTFEVGSVCCFHFLPHVYIVVIRASSVTVRDKGKARKGTRHDTIPIPWFSCPTTLHSLSGAFLLAPKLLNRQRD